MLKSLKISGNYKTSGKSKIYLEDEGIKYLVFESNNIGKSGIESITGLVIKDEKNIKINAIIPIIIPAFPNFLKPSFFALIPK